MENRPVPLVLVLAVVLGVGAQQPPATEVYLVAFDAGRMPAVTGPVTNISNNPAGYDNQPSFLPDGSAVLFTSNRDGEQTDIYRYDVATGRLTQVTRTVENEYSPIATPDGQTFSVIRQADGGQRLWRFNLDGSNPLVVLENVAPVGYHVWIDDTHLGLFVLGAGQGDPSTLQIADTTTGRAEVIEARIGRSLLMQPGGRMMSFVSMPAGRSPVVKSYDPSTRQTTELIPVVGEGQDMAWDPASGRLLMAQGSKIFGWMPGRAGWDELGDLSSSGIGRITRLTVSPAVHAERRLAVVAAPESR